MKEINECGLDKITNPEHLENSKFIDKITLAIASFQGPWNTRSSRLVKEKVMPFDEKELEDASLAEKALANILKQGLMAFIGDGSTSHMLLGRPVDLSSETKGIIILNKGISFGDYDTEVAVSDYVFSSLMLVELKMGGSYEKIESRFRKGIFGLVSLFSKVQKGFKRLHPEENIETDILPEEEINEGLVHLRKTYGGSEDQLSENNYRFKTEAVEIIKKKIEKNKNSSKLVNLQKNLELTTGDEVLDSGIRAAKELLARLSK